MEKILKEENVLRVEIEELVLVKKINVKMEGTYGEDYE